jgi:WD40 repeat protein
MDKFGEALVQKTGKTQLKGQAVTVHGDRGQIYLAGLSRSGPARSQIEVASITGSGDSGIIIEHLNGSRPRSIDISDDGHWLAVTDQNESRPAISIVDTENRKILQSCTLTGDPECFAVKWINSEATMFAAARDTCIEIWAKDPTNGQFSMKETLPVGAPAVALALSKNGNLLAIGESTRDLLRSFSGRVEFWMRRDEIWTSQLHFEFQSGVWALGIHPTRPLVAAGCDDGTVRVLNYESGAQLASVTLRPEVDRLMFTPDGKSLIAGDSWGEVAVWQIPSSETKQFLLLALRGHNTLQGSVWGMGWYSGDPSGYVLLTDEGTWRHWIAPAYPPAKPWSEYDAIIQAAQLLPQRGSFLIHLGDRLQAVLEGLPEDVLQLTENDTASLSPSGDGVAVIKATGEVRIYDGAHLAQSPIKMLPTDVAHGGVKRVQFYREYQRALCIEQNKVNIWNTSLEHAERIVSLPLSDDETRTDFVIWCAALDRAGNRVASGDNVGDVRVWDITTGNLAIGPLHLAPGIAEVTFSPDDKLLSAFTRDNLANGSHLSVWDVSGHMLGQLEFRQRVGAMLWSDDCKTVVAVTKKAVFWISINSGVLELTDAAPFAGRGIFVGGARLIDAEGRLVELTIAPIGNAIEVLRMSRDGLDGPILEGAVSTLKADWEQRLGVRILDGTPQPFSKSKEDEAQSRLSD